MATANHRDGSPAMASPAMAARGGPQTIGGGGPRARVYRGSRRPQGWLACQTVRQPAMSRPLDDSPAMAAPAMAALGVWKHMKTSNCLFVCSGSRSQSPFVFEFLRFSQGGPQITWGRGGARARVPHGYRTVWQGAAASGAVAYPARD